MAVNLMEAHYQIVIRSIYDGSLVPFLGAGVNLCNRPQSVDWNSTSDFLPSGGELSAYLAEAYYYPQNYDRYDLLRVAQYIKASLGEGALYGELRGLLNGKFASTSLHDFFARLPAILRTKNSTPRYPLIITTNYDDLLETAFQQANEPFDVVTYIALGKDQGKFRHYHNGGHPKIIELPNEYNEISLTKCTVILKIHGAIDRIDEDADSYIISEDDYIDYLTRDISNLPSTLKSRLKRSNFLFLGYSLRDWNWRAIFHRITAERIRTYKSWAVQLNPDPIDQVIWQDRNVQILDRHLSEYIENLNERLPRVGQGNVVL